MNIDLRNVGMRFGKEFLFHDLNYTLKEGEHLAILGYNGSGKSTLLQVVSGAMMPTEGEVVFKNGKDLIDPNDQYQYVAFATPYAELIEELSVEEIANFQTRIIQESMTAEEIIRMAMLENSSNKSISKLSSGMRQRLKLSLAIASNRSWVFLDEPCSNLDERGVQWYADLLERYKGERTFIICSNHYEKEYHICSKKINVADHRPNSN